MNKEFERKIEADQKKEFYNNYYNKNSEINDNNNNNEDAAEDDDDNDSKLSKLKKKNLFSVLHHESLRNKLTEFISFTSNEDLEQRKKLEMIMKKGMNFNRTKRLEIIEKMNEQLKLLMISVSSKLMELHGQYEENTINKIAANEYDNNGGDNNEDEYIPFLDKSCYSFDHFLISKENEYNEGARIKVVIVLPCPTEGQLKNMKIDGNENYPNYLHLIENELQRISNKTFQFVFSVPIFLGNDYNEKKEICDTPSLIAPFLLYTHDLILALDPDIIISVGQFAFQNTLNSFGEKNNAKNMIKMGSSLFYSYLNSSVDEKQEDGGVSIKMAHHKEIKIFYCPHPFSVENDKSDRETEEEKERFENQNLQQQQFDNEGQEQKKIDKRSKNEQQWEILWKLIANILNPEKKFQSSEKYINKETNTEIYNAVNYLKTKGNCFYKTKDAIDSLRIKDDLIIAKENDDNFDEKEKNRIELQQRKKSAKEFLKSQGVDYSQKKIKKRADPIRKLPPQNRNNKQPLNKFFLVNKK